MKKFYNLNPVATYDNAKVSKKQIMQENKGLSGVYCWTNKINGKTYIGSSVKLNRRLACYFSKKHMETILKTGKSAIYSAILKHGLAKFKLEILEYCSPAKCIKIEQQFINFIKPAYNIIKIAGSPLGFRLQKKLFGRYPLYIREFKNRRNIKLKSQHAKHSDGEFLW